jgi:hypothetical protein
MIYKLFASALVLAGVAVSATGLQVLHVLDAARPESSVYFDEGLTALDPRVPVQWTNQWCGSCHAAEYSQWADSRHAVAGTNGNFQAQFLGPGNRRKAQFCLNCHAPLNPGRDQFPNAEAQDCAHLFASPPQWLTQGVDCLSCHVRDGKVLVTLVTAKAVSAHPVRLAPELETAEFCAGCHQFRFKSLHLPDAFIGQFQQASLLEFLEVSESGVLATRCHDCHMPKGNHLMPGGYSLPMLKRALSTELAADWVDEQRVRVSVTVRAGRVGHGVPGGEFHRLLTLHTSLEDADGHLVAARSVAGSDPPPAGPHKQVLKWPQIETMGRHMGLFERGADPAAPPSSDTRPWPGRPREFDYVTSPDLNTVRLPLTVRAELWYHVVPESTTETHSIPAESTKWLVYSEEKQLEPRIAP